MSKSNGTKVVSQLVGLLLCILLMQSAVAIGNGTNESITIGNMTTYENTIDNSTNESPITYNSTIENPISDNSTIENPISDNSTIENPISDNSPVNSIYPSSHWRYLNAGGSTDLTVSFTNGGNEELFLTPKVIAALYSTKSINESWVTISPTTATVAPGSVQNFYIEINVPWDEGGYYNGNIVFTDDLVPGTDQYVDSMQLSLDVQAQPKIELQAGSIYDTVEAGKEYEYKVKIKNIAPKDLTIDPTFQIYSSDYQNKFNSDSVELSAPSTIKAGEITNMTIKVNVPENAIGTCFGHIYMNVNGRTNDWSTPGIDLSLNVRQQLTTYVKTFYAPTAGPIKIEVSADKNNQYNSLRTSPKDKGPSFELGLTRNSTPVKMTFVKSVENGGASLSSWYYPTWAGDNYQNNNGHYAATYTAPGAIGDWELTIFPKSSNNFEYSITIGDNNSVVTGNITNENIATGDTSTGDSTIEDTSAGNETDENISAVSTNAVQGNDSRITFNESSQFLPAIYGDRIVWTEDYRSGNWDIYMFNLSTHEETRITTNESGQGSPAIYGDRIVWNDFRNEIPDIYMYDLSTSKEIQITTNGWEQDEPAIYGNKIVWQDDRNGSFDIYIYNLSTHEETQITTNKSNQMEPAIYGDKIVWEDYRNGNTDIYMFDLSTDKETQITTNESDQYFPAIYGDRIVWTDHRNGWYQRDIYMYNLSTSEESRITTNKSEQYSPAIYGDRIVWTDERNGNYDIYMYDLSTSKETRITTNESVKDGATIYGNRIVWTDMRNGNADIYMFNVSEEDPKLEASIGNLSANYTDQGPLVRNPQYSIFNSVISIDDSGDCIVNSPGDEIQYRIVVKNDGNVDLTNVIINDPMITLTGPIGNDIDPEVLNPGETWVYEGDYVVTQEDIDINGGGKGVIENTATVSCNELSNESSSTILPIVKTPPITVTPDSNISKVLPIADFSANVTMGCAPLSVQFTDLSENATEWSWDFGDSSYSTARNPAHAYNETGKYTVSLTVKDKNGIDKENKRKYVLVSKK